MKILNFFILLNKVLFYCPKTCILKPLNEVSEKAFNIINIDVVGFVPFAVNIYCPYVITVSKYFQKSFGS